MLKRVSDFSGSLTIDPGDSTGYAYWSGLLSPKVGQFNNNCRAKDLELQLCHMLKKFDALLDDLHPELVVIESVEVWGGSLTSITSAVRGNLMKLSYMVGVYSALCDQRGITFKLIPARRWKGQLSKDAVKLRVYRAIKKHYPQTHMTDAVGIGLHCMGLL